MLILTTMSKTNLKTQTKDRLCWLKLIYIMFKCLDEVDTLDDVEIDDDVDTELEVDTLTEKKSQ